MSPAQFNAEVGKDIAALVKIGFEQARTNYTPPEPGLDLAPCVCGIEDRDPAMQLDVRVNCHTTIDCPNCDRGVGARTKTEAIALWNRGANAEAERDAWKREQAMLLEALRDMLDVFHDDPDSGQYTAYAVIERAQDAVERATK